MKITAELNYLKIAPRKVRLVADVIRGKEAPVAERQLQFLTKRAAGPLLKLLRSAVAGAEQNFNMQKANLRVEKVTVDGGSVFKRVRPRAFGRAFTVRRRTSHITMVLGEIRRGAAPANIHRRAGAPVVVREKEGQAFAEEAKRTDRSRREGKWRAPKRGADVIRKVFQRKAV